MSKIYSLKINNFRGIQNFEQVFGNTNLVCILGRGDSGKTTILEAISMVLSPSWSTTFIDSDFYDCNINVPIIIEASLYDLPIKLLTESKFGLYKRGLNPDTGDVNEQIQEGDIDLLTIRLTVEKDLEPRWQVVNDRPNQENVEIRASDRAILNAFYISDYIDRHFSWNRGTPLYSLLKEEEPASGTTDAIIDALREAKTKIDEEPFAYLDHVTEKVIGVAAALGVDIKGTSTTVDLKDLTIKDGRICLHDGKVPFRLKGKGSKRLISIAVQMELAKTGGIILIDEIEQGLEPDRVKHLAKTLKASGAGQVFITTHSRDVLVELEPSNLYKLKKGNSQLFIFDDSLQAVIRSNPESIFSEKVLIGEGATEVGICRGINRCRYEIGLKNMATLGVVIANGGGDTMMNYAHSFLKAGYLTALFCDSDNKEANSKKKELIDAGCTIIDCDEGNSIEDQIFADLPWAGVKKFLTYHIEANDIVSVKSSVQSKYKGGTLPDEWMDTDTSDIRNAITAAAKNGKWYKRIDHGEYIGFSCFKSKDKIPEGKKLRSILDDISNWINHD